MFFWVQFFVAIPPSLGVWCYACGCESYSSFLPMAQNCSGKCKGTASNVWVNFLKSIIEGDNNVQVINCPIGFCHSLSFKQYDGSKSYDTKNCYNKEQHPLEYWRSLPTERGARRKINGCYTLKAFVESEECLCNLNNCNSANTITQKVILFSFSKDCK